MTKCNGCGKAASLLRKIDVPEGFSLCDECYEFTWICARCDSVFASLDIEGGRDPGVTPFPDEVWCEECCDKRLTECRECGSVDVIEDMKETDEGLLCSSCAGGYGPLCDDSSLLDEDNWRDAVLRSIHDLPADLQASIGYFYRSALSMTVTIAGEPISSFDDDDNHRESHVTSVEIRYRHSIWDQGRVIEQEEAEEEDIDFWPIISVEATDLLNEVSEEFDVGRDSIASFQHFVQLAILDAMWSGGGHSLVYKDEKGRFVRSDETRILDWQ